jgi:signal transduction histidine kinase/ActR/RegA family two-component response regulator
LNGLTDNEHFVQFYESEDYFIGSLAEYIAVGLHAGDAVVVVATESHLKALAHRLPELGVDGAAAEHSGNYLPLDAHHTLVNLMVNGKLSTEQFKSLLGGVVARANQQRGRVRVFGELVALLWADENYHDAIRLEKLWNELQLAEGFTLFCAYPMASLGKSVLEGPFGEVCCTHTRVIPGESYSALTESDEQLRAIVRLQQKANSLEREIAERERAEAGLKLVKEELETQVQDLRRLHEMSLGLTGTLNIDTVLNEVLNAALAVNGSNQGLLSLCDPEGAGITVKLSRGLDGECLNELAFVPSGAGACFAQKQRVVVEDVETDPLMMEYRELARKAGFRACHSTPLITRSGVMIGVLSVYFAEAHRPAERETRLMDLYARMAADTIENARLHQQVQDELARSAELLGREQMARSQAESANRMKDEFLATVSHELRTPLNAILGWSHMLRNGRLDGETASRAIETIERNAKSQAQLVEDILDVSRMITGKLRLHMGLVDVASVINAAIDSVQLAADSRQIDLKVILDPSARHVLGDANRLQQTVWNLLSNAIKFTPPGGQVTIKLEHSESNILITVNDTGQGISVDFLPWVFDRFRQGDGTSTRRHGGLGLGLAIVRHLVELHGGEVSAASEGEGQGATFTISLPAPIRPTDAVQTKVAAVNPPANGAEAVHQSLPALSGLRILVVDDDGDNLQMIAALLEQSRAEVRIATSAGEAMEVLQRYEPHVLVFDLAMPGEDGYSLIQRIRSQETGRNRDLPAIALTAHVRVDDRVRALSAGFDLFLPKPVEFEELLGCILNAAKLSRADRV